MDIQLLTQADFHLSRCGRPVAPKGLSVVYIPKGFTVNQFFSLGTATPTQTITKEITGDTPWCLRDMQIFTSAATAVSLPRLRAGPVRRTRRAGYGRARRRRTARRVRDDAPGVLAHTR